MGYWSTNETGVSFVGSGEMLWGDAPADIFGKAVDEVIAVFEADIGRRPSMAELKVGLLFSARILDLEEYPPHE